MVELLNFNNKVLYKKDLKNTIEQLGIKSGDIICMPSELFNFGIPMQKKNDFLKSILECFFDVLGEDGTLIMPTFTYSFCKNEIYDKVKSTTKMGALNEYFRNQEGVKRTNDPIFSFAVKGAKEDLFLKDSASCFGENSVYDCLIKNNGKYVLFGTTIGHTLTHRIEEEVGVEYRYFKTFNGLMIDEYGKKIDKSIEYYVRCLDKKSLPDVDNINKITRSTKSFIKQSFGGADICVFDAKEYREALINALKKDKFSLVLK